MFQAHLTIKGASHSTLLLILLIRQRLSSLNNTAVSLAIAVFTDCESADCSDGLYLAFVIVEEDVYLVALYASFLRCFPELSLVACQIWIFRIFPFIKAVAPKKRNENGIDRCVVLVRDTIEALVSLLVEEQKESMLLRSQLGRFNVQKAVRQCVYCVAYSFEGLGVAIWEIVRKSMLLLVGCHETVNVSYICQGVISVP